jgi:hypothetical protein
MIGKKKDIQQEIFLKELYSNVSSSNEEQYLSEINGFIEHSMKISNSQEAILKEAARAIYRIFEFKEIAIGKKDKDGMYRFHEMIGFRNEAVNARKRLVYDSNDMADGTTYQSLRIGKYSQIHLSEHEPFRPGEEASYNHPELLGKPRINADDMVEGDYLDIYLYGRKKELLGWIELSGTRNRKLMTRESILWLEFFSSCLALLLSNARKN